MRTYEQEILWGRRGSIITEYTVNGLGEYGDFASALGKAVEEAYRDSAATLIAEQKYINDYGDQPKTQTAQWRVSPTHKGFNLEKVE